MYRLIFISFLIASLAGCSTTGSSTLDDGFVERRAVSVDTANCAAVNLSDVTAQPLIRVRHVTPKSAIENGQCLMRYNVNRLGQTTDIKADCSDKIFENNAYAAIEGFKYNLKIKNGISVPRCGVEYLLDFPITR